MDDRPTKIEQTDARQARTGVGVRYVLIASLVLVVVALLTVFLVVR